MQGFNPIDTESQFGACVADHRLPLVYLRERRRELVLALEKRRGITSQQIQEIAMVHQAIKAIETVLTE
ncbi:MAG: hypothetical protein R3D69_04375 [Xanthobacteraceae bacterium]